MNFPDLDTLIVQKLCEAVMRDPSLKTLKKKKQSEQERTAFKKLFRVVRAGAQFDTAWERARNRRFAWLVVKFVRTVHASGKQLAPEALAVEWFMLRREGGFPLDADELEFIKAQDAKSLQTGDTRFLKRWCAAVKAGQPTGLSANWTGYLPSTSPTRRHVCLSNLDLGRQ